MQFCRDLFHYLKQNNKNIQSKTERLKQQNEHFLDHNIIGKLIRKFGIILCHRDLMPDPTYINIMLYFVEKPQLCNKKQQNRTESNNHL